MLSWLIRRISPETALDLAEVAVEARLLALAEVELVARSARRGRRTRLLAGDTASLSVVSLSTSSPSPGKVMLCCSLARLAS